MSTLGVRANLKMVFDNPSAEKSSAKFMSRLSSLEKATQNNARNLNNKLSASSAKLIKDLQTQNAAADDAMVKGKAKVAMRVQNLAKKSLKSLKPADLGKKATDKDKARYKKELAEYNKTVTAMKHANERYMKHAQSLKAKAALTKGGAFSQSAFLKNEASLRKELIALQEMEVKASKKGTAERRANQIILDGMNASHKAGLALEQQKGQVVSANNAKVRAALAFETKGRAMNNRLMKEQMALLGRINAAYTSITAQLSGAFMSGMIASGIAIMSVTFKLQELVSTFLEFEKELMNAQSIFQATNETLFGLSDEIVKFGTRYGVSLGTASEGLYTLASAGLSASDSQQVLANTLKLSMAVQGDHDTIAKLTTQTLFGFGKEMSESASLTDKFAHSINKSLIEYQDLASAVKFAMPFFVSTNQEIDQLLGALQILSNRALEAGIAGRGLRQALAEFAQHAEDNTAAFRKMGVEIVNTDGSFKQLTEIASQFREALGPAASDVDLMTTLLQDLNVRGATAFVHLVQSSDEFEAAVNDLQNSTGAATQMAEIQQQSLANQIQVIKNALLAPFLISEKVEGTNDVLNTFGQRLHNIAGEFESLFLVVMPDGTRQLTEMGQKMRDTVLIVLEDLADLSMRLLNLLANMSTEGNGLASVIHALVMPIRILAGFINLLGENGLQMIMMLKVFNMIAPISQMHTIANTLATLRHAQAEAVDAVAIDKKTDMLVLENGQMVLNTKTQAQLAAAQVGSQLLMFAGIALINKSARAYQILGYAILAAAGALMAYNVAVAIGRDSMIGGGFGLYAATAAGAATMVAFGAIAKSAMTPPPLSIPDPVVADLGMRMYDMGGIAGRHFPVMVEAGETIIPKTQNMLSNGAGITLNIAGDIITNDAEDFAERVADVLPDALRRVNDIGGI